MDLCILILTKTSVNFDKKGKFQFSSFLVDMNELFEFFIFGLLLSNINRNVTIRGGRDKKAIMITNDKVDSISRRILIGNENLRFANPDIVVGKSSGKWSVVINAKYKRGAESPDLYQIWIYAIALGLPSGILVYPKHELNKEYPITLKNEGTIAHVLTVDLSTPLYRAFKNECSRFILSVGKVIGMPDLFMTG
jgi:5-methylcytosine-specific restriction endonuclease McrBC regulatory subunit McrC